MQSGEENNAAVRKEKFTDGLSQPHNERYSFLIFPSRLGTNRKSLLFLCFNSNEVTRKNAL